MSDLDPPDRVSTKPALSAAEVGAMNPMVYIHTARQVHARIGVGDSGNDKTELSSALARLDVLQFGLELEG